MSRILLLLLLNLTLFPVLAQESVVGEAYDLDGGQLLYREHHQFEFAEGQLVGDRVEYRRPDGSLIGHKTLDYRPGSFIPAVHTEFHDGRFVEGLRYVKGEIEIYQRKGKDAREKTKTIKRREAMAADAGFTRYLRSHFDTLIGGKELSFHMVAPSRLTAVKFDARKIGERQIEATPVVDIRVEISSFLSLFVDPLLLSYDPDSRQLIEYRGMSNVRDADGEQYKVRIRFPAFMRKPAAAAQTPP